MASTIKGNVRSSAKDGLKQQEITQAVVIADSFQQKFTPLTNSKPMVLLPVVNGTLLEYVLKSLEECGIQETFIFCCLHNQLIRSYVNSSRWSKTDAPMSVNVISSSSFMSMGDIMRELDSKAFIRTDFVLINGNVITTFPLCKVLEEHRVLRQKDKNCAITLLYRKATPKHRIRCKEDSFLVAVESASKKIRYYQRVNKLKAVHIPLEVFQENEEVTIHYDLLDSHISICSPCVPPLFSDNFDYQSIDDFVKGLIVNEELLGNSMYIHIAKSGYGASISNLYMYDAVSQDIMSRWTFPVVPDLADINANRFTHSRHNIYKESVVIIERNCQIKQNVVLGKGTKVGENTIITNSVIGKNCSIGSNTVIKGSYLWNGVTVGDFCNLNTCLLAESVKLLNKVTVNPGCVLGSEVVIGDNVTLPSYTRLQAQVFDDEDSFGEDEFEERSKPCEDKSCDVTLVGEGGQGFLCRVSDDSDDDEKEEAEDVWGKTDDAPDYDDDTSESSDSEVLNDGGSEESDGAADDGYDDEAAFFFNEVLESLQRGIEEKVKSENMILEINSSKHAYNVTMKEVNTLLIKAVLKLPFETHKQAFTPQLYLTLIKPTIQFFQPLVSNYIQSAESQLDCLFSVEEFMKSNEDLSAAVLKVVHLWYDLDILNEAVIVKWYNNLSPEQDKIRKLSTPFIKWLQEADEESSED